MNKYDPSTQVDSSSRGPHSKGLNDMNFNKLVMNSSSKPNINNINPGPYDQGPFSKTYGDRPSGGGTHLMNLI